MRPSTLRAQMRKILRLRDGREILAKFFPKPGAE